MKVNAMDFLIFILLFVVGGSNAINITVNWNKIIYTSKTSTTLQVVVNPYVQRGSPIHNETFAALSNLQADYVRFVPWLPYPQLSVAELQPPTGNPVCTSILNFEELYLSCYAGVFESFEFASYGTPTGECGNFAVGKCHSSFSLSVVEKSCLGKQSCYINVTFENFGEPCMNVEKRLAVQGTCSTNIDKTFWNFTLLDPLMEDFMNATADHSVIINFSTTPQWMWNTPGPVEYPDDPQQVFWGYEQGTDLRDPSMRELANYYQRLVGWYTNGGFFDEYSEYHKSGHFYNITMWEVLNEVEAEHEMSPESYTKIYDAIVTAILEVQPNMQFVGLALAFRGPAWLEYFLNSSNHLPGVPIDWISYHFYANCDERDNVTQYESFFSQADGFLQEVVNLQSIRNSLAPHVKTTIDEVGVILPDDNDTDPLPSAIVPIYWNAAGAMYAYIFGNIILQGIEVLGESQLVGYPTQFPSVSMMDWETAQPNSRYWVLSLLHSNFHPGDQLAFTVSSESSVYAQGFITPAGKKILIINKTQEPQSVTVEPFTSGGKLEYVDLSTFDSPPAIIFLESNTFIIDSFGVGILSFGQ